MKALLIWPILPNSFWSFRETLDLAGLRASTPPLGLITVAVLLPPTWEIRFIDRNVQFETDEDWAWCDLALLSAMRGMNRFTLNTTLMSKVTNVKTEEGAFNIKCR